MGWIGLGGKKLHVSTSAHFSLSSYRLLSFTNNVNNERSREQNDKAEE